MHWVGGTPAPCKAATAPRRLLCPDLAAAQRTKNPRPRARPPGTDPPPEAAAPPGLPLPRRRDTPPPPRAPTPSGAAPSPPAGPRRARAPGRPTPLTMAPPAARPDLPDRPAAPRARLRPPARPPASRQPASQPGPAAANSPDAGAPLCGGRGISGSAPDGGRALLEQPMGVRAGTAGRGGLGRGHVRAGRGLSAAGRTGGGVRVRPPSAPIGRGWVRGPDWGPCLQPPSEALLTPASLRRGKLRRTAGKSVARCPEAGSGSIPGRSKR